MTDSDVTQVYLTYIVLGGNVERTAVACEVDPAQLREWVEKEDWNSRLQVTDRLLTASQGGRAHAERLLNRATTYVQIVRLRRVVDVILSQIEQRMASYEGDDLLSLFQTKDDKGNTRLDLKPIENLARTAQALGDLAMKAMSDTVTERIARLKNDEEHAREQLTLGDAVLSNLRTRPVSAPGTSEVVALEAVESIAPCAVEPDRPVKRKSRARS